MPADAITSIGLNSRLIAATRPNDTPMSNNNTMTSQAGISAMACMSLYKKRSGTRIRALSCCKSGVDSSISRPSS